MGSRRDARPTIRFAPVEFGYGPLGKALHIARAIRGLAGDAVRLELIASANFRAPAEAGLFDGTDRHDGWPTEPADAVVTIMNVKGIRQAAARGERIYVVDSLAWLWDAPLPVQDLIRVYFYQDLPVLPTPSRNLVGMPDPTPIPAIGNLPGEGNAGTDGARVVISLSGIETPDSRLALGTLCYPPYVLDCLEHLVDAGRLDPEELAVFGNATVVRHFAGPRVARALRRGTQREFGAAARSAGSVACPPGLTTIVECLRAGVGLRLLPPQNYSQVKLLRAFRDAAGIPALPWTGPLVRWLEDATLPENVGAEIVRGVVANARAATGRADPEAVRALLAQDPPVPDKAGVEALIGPDDGALTVAGRVLADLGR